MDSTHWFGGYFDEKKRVLHLRVFLGSTAYTVLIKSYHHENQKQTHHFTFRN